MITKLLVGTDGSQDAVAAVTWAGAAAAQLGAELIVMHAVGLLEHLEGHEEIAHGVRERVEALLSSDWSEPARALGASVICVTEEGPPVLAIPRVAEREAVDLIVVGRRGRSVGATLMGSTSHGLSQTATIPVVVIPAAE